MTSKVTSYFGIKIILFLLEGKKNFEKKIASYLLHSMVKINYAHMIGAINQNFLKKKRKNQRKKKRGG